nr:uncharacterized protein LOC109777254 isoform X2 [Aegilops tauschii subsp. strangulata]
MWRDKCVFLCKKDLRLCCICFRYSVPSNQSHTPISSPNCFRTAAAALQLRRHSSGMRSTATMVATATTPSRTLFSPIVRLLVQKGAGLGTRSSHAITLISSMAYSFGCEYAFNLKAQSWYALDLAG